MLPNTPLSRETRKSSVKREGLPRGFLLVVDLDKPTSLPGRVLMFPWRNNPALKDNLEGRVPEIIQNAGFQNIHNLRHGWRWFISFWLATKPGK